jgi:hypothetical protein
VLLMKAWMETRWRLLGVAMYVLIALAMRSLNPAGTNVLTTLWFLLTFLAISLGGSGVRSQAPLGFSAGLAGSTQFTLSLPVSRLRLLVVRAAAGLVETAAATVAVACVTWALVPNLRQTAAPGDFARLVITTILFLSAPYCAHVFFTTWVEEPYSMAYATFTLMLLLFFGHRLAPAVDIIRAFGQASPLLTHRLPWPQLTASVMLALMLTCAAVEIVRRREY